MIGSQDKYPEVYLGFYQTSVMELSINIVKAKSRWLFSWIVRRVFAFILAFTLRNWNLLFLTFRRSARESCNSLFVEYNKGYNYSFWLTFFQKITTPILLSVCLCHSVFWLELKRLFIWLQWLGQTNSNRDKKLYTFLRS